MLLTPPDIVSQTLLAIPVWLLFELGIIFSRLMIKKPETENNQSTDAKTNDKAGSDIDAMDDPDLADQISDEDLERELDNIDKKQD